MRLALVASLAVAGYFGGAALLPSETHAVETDEEKCERDKCQAVDLWNATGICVDAPDQETGCDAKFSWWRGKHYCETYSCGEDE